MLMTQPIALAARIGNVRTQRKINGDLVLRKSDASKSGTALPRSQPRSMGTSFTSHFKSHSTAKFAVCKLPKGGNAWPEDAAGFLVWE